MGNKTSLLYGGDASCWFKENRRFTLYFSQRNPGISVSFANTIFAKAYSKFPSLFFFFATFERDNK